VQEGSKHFHKFTSEAGWAGCINIGQDQCGSTGWWEEWENGNVWRGKQMITKRQNNQNGPQALLLPLVTPRLTSLCATTGLEKSVYMEEWKLLVEAEHS
jgi:hypothetical protein